MKEVYFAYVLKSKNFDYFYKGHCKDLQKRLDQHNSGMTVAIRPYVPFEIVYFEEFETLIEAIKREKYFKSSRGRQFLKKLLKSR
jgi:putative endonuclease